MYTHTYIHITDKDHSERASEAQRRLLENRTRILLDKNTKSTQKLQGETELRIAERLHNRSADNEVAALRKRNLDVLSKVQHVYAICTCDM